MHEQEYPLSNVAVKERHRKALRRKTTKEKLVNLLGNECSKCGYNAYLGALQFHHLEAKQFNLSRAIANRRETDLVQEISNCILLCTNCHLLEHSNNSTTSNLSSIRSRIRVRKRKQALIRQFNNVCFICQNSNHHNLTFHHVNSADKMFGLSGEKGFNRTPEKIFIEAQKCVLLCGNCHAETEAGLHRDHEQYWQNNLPLLAGDANDFKKMIDYPVNLPASVNYCLDCENKITKQATRCIYCSHQHARTIARPSKAFLLKEIKTLGYSGVGRKYGVSDNAIRKWLRK